MGYLGSCVREERRLGRSRWIICLPIECIVDEPSFLSRKRRYSPLQSDLRMSEGGNGSSMFLDCAQMFDRDGPVVEDRSVRRPGYIHSYRILDFDLLDEHETKEEVHESNRAIRRFLGAKWHSDSGANRAGMMASTLSFGGRDVGIFPSLPDRSDSGKKTRDIAFCYFMGSEASYWHISMGGVLHADWIFGEREPTRI